MLFRSNAAAKAVCSPAIASRLVSAKVIREDENITRISTGQSNEVRVLFLPTAGLRENALSLIRTQSARLARRDASFPPPRFRVPFCESHRTMSPLIECIESGDQASNFAVNRTVSRRS